MRQYLIDIRISWFYYPVMVIILVFNFSYLIMNVWGDSFIVVAVMIIIVLLFDSDYILEVLFRLMIE